jgi:hypothetical protein
LDYWLELKQPQIALISPDVCANLFNILLIL